jgi:hypothetical protein
MAHTDANPSTDHAPLDQPCLTSASNASCTATQSERLRQHRRRSLGLSTGKSTARLRDQLLEPRRATGPGVTRSG